jgi:phosphatidylglycerol lysyltransferase
LALELLCENYFLSIGVDLWSKQFWRSLFGILLILLFIVFLAREKTELIEIDSLLRHVHLGYLLLALVVSGLYIATQSLLLQESIRLVGKKIPLRAAISLYLKRFFISTFIPTGFTVAQFTYADDIRKYNVSTLENHLASLLYLALGIIDYSVLLFIIAVSLFFRGDLTPVLGFASFTLLIVVGLIIWALFTVPQQKGIAYRVLTRFLPDLPQFLHSWNSTFHQSLFFPALLTALVADLLGVLTFWIAFQAFYIPAGIFLAFAGHVITILLMTISPLFQGIGLVEVSLLYILTRFGLTRPDAFAATLFYRLFQVWVPFLAGLIMTVRKRQPF